MILGTGGLTDFTLLDTNGLRRKSPERRNQSLVEAVQDSRVGQAALRRAGPPIFLDIMVGRRSKRAGPTLLL